MMETIKLLLTVSGGLEDLAEKQVREFFGERLLMQLKWHRKPSGSQLYLTLHARDSDNAIAVEIAESMRRLDYVEYVYALLDSFRVASDGDDGNRLLQEIEEVTSLTPLSSIDFCKRLCKAALEKSPADAMLEGLTGLLLPTPNVSPSSSSSPLPKASHQDFDVNTIYTKPNVARAVIGTVTEFCRKHRHQCNDETTIWVDAGSGNGALLENMPSKHSIGVDTHPASPKVRQMDFLELSRPFLNREFPDHERLIVVSNPPFSSSSRGDYAPIVAFINHSFDDRALGADIVAVICPSKFARKRVWKSLGMTEESLLLGRFFLPQNSFYNPCTGEEVHIHSYCLIFGRKDGQDRITTDATIGPKRGVYLSAKRDKGIFSDISTVNLTKSIVSGLSEAGMEFVPERNAQFMLNAKLIDSSSLELWWHLNPHLPYSLVNSNCWKVSSHSLGWLSLSVKPPVALAMASMSLNNDETDVNNTGRLAINLMSGEGTIELEASRAVNRPFYILTGDKSQVNAAKTAKRIQTLQSSNCRRPLIDVVVWDAQNLPLRKGIADAIFADLPFQGSIKKMHQEPKVGKVQCGASVSSAVSPLSYKQVLDGACKVLKANGRAALLSPDFRALRHASSQFNWSQLGYSMSVNLGGLNGKLYLMKRNEASTKDVSMRVPSSTDDLSSWIFGVSNRVCRKERNGEREYDSHVTSVHLHSTYFHAKTQALSHCYRVKFDNMVRNVEAKGLEKLIRQGLADEALGGITLR